MYAYDTLYIEGREGVRGSANNVVAISRPTQKHLLETAARPIPPLPCRRGCPLPSASVSRNTPADTEGAGDRGRGHGGLVGAGEGHPVRGARRGVRQDGRRGGGFRPAHRGHGGEFVFCPYLLVFVLAVEAKPVVAVSVQC